MCCRKVLLCRWPFIPGDSSAESIGRRERGGSRYEDICGKRSNIKHTAQGSMFEHTVLCIRKIENMLYASKVTIQTSFIIAKGS